MFQHFDKDRSGTIDGLELQSALNQFGMKLPPHLMSLLLAKFGTLGKQSMKKSSLELTSDFATATVASSTSGSEVGEQTITFDRFMRACVFVKQFMESFRNLDTDKDGWLQLNYEQFLQFYFLLP